VQNQSSPLVLSFGVADPLGAIGTHADVAVFAALGAHGLSVNTGLLLADSVRIEEIHAIDTDWMADQARHLLEDMRVAAFKIGGLANAQQVQAIGEIVSDYPDVPLIVDPFLSALPEAGIVGDHMLESVRQVLVPQATVLLLSHMELLRMSELWRDAGPDDTADDAQQLIASGCEFVLVNSIPPAQGSGDQKTLANTLYDAEGELETFSWQKLPGAFIGAGNTLSAAVAALMAHGMEAPDACAAAQEFTANALARARRFGMGKAVPNPFYQAKDHTA
jgi:hydroxymethylpyrimidine/phosphomethylpyrimidine kinase